MPHLIIEHSANVGDRVDIGDLVDRLHAAALATGIAPLDALRTRAAARDHFAIADRHPDNAFVAVTARLGAGRSDDDKRRFVAALMDALDDQLGDARHTVMLSVEYQEIDPEFRENRNHLRPVVAARTDDDSGDAHDGS
jgi:5-carboxymethyl-2-hydroxymuconate isomerase